MVNILAKRSLSSRQLARVIRPLQEFIKLQSAGGILLLACTVIALAWTNSPWESSYHATWGTEVSLRIGGFSLAKSLLHWINDGLMVVFFFVVGLEIKREVLIGELSTPRQSMLPIAAAFGGMVMPALIYTVINHGKPGAAGWGIPMATDIAFAVGVLTLLGKRVPLSLKVFLTALAIADDLGAVLVIALFYTAELSLSYLGWAAGFLFLLIVANMLDIRRPLVYAALGIGLWFAFLKSGVHATVAGVLLAMTIPARAAINKRELVEQGQTLLNAMARSNPADDRLEGEGQAIVQTLQKACERVESPMQRLASTLHPWVTFIIVPVFALANAGVTLEGSFLEALEDPVSLGIILGLVLGKQVGITAFSWLAVKLRLAVLPGDVRWGHIYGVSWLGGIGFTMSLFIATLAFGESGALDVSKIGILTASLVAGVVGWLYLGIIARGREKGTTKEEIV